MARTKLSVALLFVFLSGIVALIVGGCPAPEPNEAEKVCTAGAYVFCRCQDKAEGTKLCNQRGNAFEKCVCGAPDRKSDPFGDAGFEQVGEQLPDDATTPLAEACVGKLAVLGSTEEKDDADLFFDQYIYGATYSALGKWTVVRARTNPPRGPPRGGVINGALIAVWNGVYQRILWTRFEANQENLLAPTMVRTTTEEATDTVVPPVFVSGPATGRIFYLGTDERAENADRIREGTYSPTNGWDEASSNLPNTPAVAGKSAPAAALVGSNYVVAYNAADKKIRTQAQTSGTWGAPTPIPEATAFDGVAPAMVALASATEELLLVYQGSDQQLRWTVRAGGGWAVPQLVDPTATGDGRLTLATMTKGRAMLVWMGIDGRPLSSLYDPAAATKWSSPAPILNAPKLRTPPTVSSGRCGGDALATYVDDTGNVNVAAFSGGKWVGPFVVPGLRRLTWAGTGEVP